MSGLNAGVSTFCSCNKAGSIPHFTKHLQSYPNDFTALTWRGRAYSIIGDNASARADFRKAMSVSVDPDKSLAEADLVNIDDTESSERRRRRYVAILQRTTQNYPRCARAWSDFGSFYYSNNDYETSLPMEKKAATLGKENGETKSPWYPWCNHTIGQIYLMRGDTTEAKKYYNAAIESCSSLTVGHLGLCNASVMENNFYEAERHFQTARKLNPVLVDHENFDSYYQTVFASRAKGGRGKHNIGGVRNRGGNSGGGGGGGGGKGGGNGGGNGGSDDEAFRRWKAFEAASPCVAKYRGKILALDEEGKFWYSYDMAKHGGAFLKKYKNTRNHLEFFGSVDKNWEDMPGKHESNEGKVIYKSDLDIVRRR